MVGLLVRAPPSEQELISESRQKKFCLSEFHKKRLLNSMNKSEVVVVEGREIHMIFGSVTPLCPNYSDLTPPPFGTAELV